MTLLTPLHVVALVVPVAIVAIAVSVAPLRTASTFARLPVIGPLGTVACYRCDHAEWRSGAEEMPVVWNDDQDATNALTICFCRQCSCEMSFRDRLGYLRGETGIEFDLPGDGGGRCE